jgi:hypothetical protein
MLLMLHFVTPHWLWDVTLLASFSLILGFKICGCGRCDFLGVRLASHILE